MALASTPGSLFDEWRYLDHGEPGQHIAIDLEAQCIQLAGSALIRFEIEAGRKPWLIN